MNGEGAARKFPCCEHCKYDPWHDTYKELHPVPCVNCNQQREA